MIRQLARPWHSDHCLIVKAGPSSTPVEGQICRRLGEAHPETAGLTLEDVPVEKPQSKVGLTERHGYWLTPIEVPFYDALRETGLTLAVQPWVQGTDRKYRLDFLIFQDGHSVAVELDGHEGTRQGATRPRCRARPLALDPGLDEPPRTVRTWNSFESYNAERNLRGFTSSPDLKDLSDAIRREQGQ